MPSLLNRLGQNSLSKKCPCSEHADVCKSIGLVIRFIRGLPRTGAKSVSSNEKAHSENGESDQALAFIANENFGLGREFINTPIDGFSESALEP
jgi:hypothetical protein